MLGVAFFVCGTPSNNRGFELVELGPEKLPGSPAAYLDKAPAGTVECHRIEPLQIDGQRYVQYSRILRINPNDAQANRGAYLAVGCLLRERLAFHTVSNCLDIVSELYGRVCAGLRPDRSFPTGYRLANFTHDGPPLEQKAAYQCSPLLVADVVLQAVNREGSIDWQNTKELLLNPEEMLASDVGRYQLYSRQGLLGSLASIDADRAHVQQTAQRATAAAQALVELQREWAELEGSAERLLMKGEALQHLTLEVERSVKRNLALDAAPTRDGRVKSQPPAPIPMLAASARALHGREHRQESLRIGSGRAARAMRDRNVPKQRHWLRGAGWAGVSAAVVLGSLLIFIAIVAVQKFVLPDLTVAPAPSQAVSGPEPQDGQQVAEQPEDDVAKERAALDALPDE
jgi:hypothetical protein